MSFANLNHWGRQGRRLSSGRSKPKNKNHANLGVESVESRQLLATFTVVNTNDNGADSLRQAIINANANPGVDRIEFVIPGGGPHSINLATELPVINDQTGGVLIDGYSQPGATPNTLAVGDNASIRIIINGGTIANPQPTSSGLVLNSDDNEVRGLSIVGFGGNISNRFGVVIAGNGNGADNNHVYGNFIGLLPNGVSNDATANTNGVGIRNALPNNLYALAAAAGSASGNDVGRLAGFNSGIAGANEFSERNVISGANDRPGISAGVQISGLQATDNTVAGNYLGTDLTGNATSADLFNIYGVRLQLGANNNTVGGPLGPEFRNVISGLPAVSPNGTDAGVLIVDDQTSNNTIQGNWIGVQANNIISGLGVNIGIGVNARTLAGFNAARIQNNLILQNRIANSAESGIDVVGDQTFGNTISRNSISNNGQLGIDLTVDDVVTGNDPLDTDLGANDATNFPTLVSAFNNGIDVRLTGTFSGAPSSTYLIEIFNNDVADPSGNGEGQRFLGSVSVTTDANGQAVIPLQIFTPAQAAIGSFITSTATVTATAQVGTNVGSTSEFSNAIPVLLQTRVSINDAVVTESDDNGVSFINFTLTASNNIHSGFAINFSALDLAAGQAPNFGAATNSVDFLQGTGQVFFNPGQTSLAISIPVVGDNVAELDELLRVVLDSASFVAPNEAVLLLEDINDPNTGPIATGQGLIFDNDASFSINDVQVLEGGNLSFTVSLAGPVNRTLTVQFSVSDGSANGGSDYTPLAAGTLTFPAGTTTQNVVVASIQELLPEGAENLFVNLSTPQYGVNLPALNLPFSPVPAASVPVIAAKLSDAQGVGTILDDDSPISVASISDIVVAENAGNATFTVTLNQASTSNITFAFGTANGSALAGSDYTATIGTVTIPAGQTTANFNIPLIDNAIPEFDENFFVNLVYQSGNVVIADTQAQATIVDNDADTNIRVVIDPIGSPAIEGPGAVLTYRVRLVDQNGNPAQSDKTVLVNYSSGAAGDTATANLDYQAAAGTLAFAPGENVKTIILPVLVDDIFENQETASVVLSNAINASIATGSAIGLINDSTTPIVSIQDVVVAENAGNATLTVTLNQAANSPVVLNFGTANGSALSGPDYVAIGGQVVIPAGQTSAVFNVALVDDAIPEFDETFFVNLALQGDNAVLGDSQAQVTIVDNDGDNNVQVIIEPLRDTSVEPAAGQDATVSFRVRLLDQNGAPARSDKTVLVNFSSNAAGDTAISDRDYKAVGGTLVFAPGENVKIVDVNILNDNLFEPTEQFTVSLINAVNASIVTANATGIILDRTVPVVTVDDIVVNESVGNATFTIQLSQASSAPIVVNFGTANGTALAGLDYSASAGTVIIPAGQTSANFTVPIIDNLIPEFDEAFVVNLALESEGAVLEDLQAQATIVDNDDDVNIRVVIDTVSNPATEPLPNQTGTNGASVTFRVRLLDPNGNPARSDKTVLVNYGSSAAGDTAISNGDYLAIGGTLVFAPGENIKLLDVPVVGDNLFENTENFTVSLLNAVNANILTGSAVGTILDRTIPTAFVSNVIVTEGTNAFATLTVQLAQPTNAPVVVAFSTFNGTASATEDYIPVAGTVTIPAGQTSITFQVPIVNNNIQELTEQFGVTLTVLTNNATLLSDETRVTILDDDNNVCAIIEQIDTTVREPRAGEAVFANFRVRLIDAAGNPIRSDVPVQVNFISGAAGDTATSDLDYQGVGGTLTFAPGENAKVISVPILQDNRFEFDPERFTVRLINVVNGKIGPNGGSAIGTILDNSPPAKVVDVQRLGTHRDTTSITIKFDTPLDPATAQNVNNYHLVSTGPDNRFGTRDDAPIQILSAVLSPDGFTVTLNPTQIKLARRLQLVINGTQADGVRDANGVQLIDGDRDGQAGGNAVLTIGKRDIRRGIFLGNTPVKQKPFGHPLQIKRR